MNNDEFNFKFPNKEDINIDYKKKHENYIKIQNEYNEKQNKLLEKYKKDQEDDCNHIMNLLIKSLNDSLLTNKNYINLPIYRQNLKNPTLSLRYCKNYKIFVEKIKETGINYNEKGYSYKSYNNQIGEVDYDVLSKVLTYIF